MKKRYLLTMLLLSGVLAFSACGKKDEAEEPAAEVQTEQPAMVITEETVQQPVAEDQTAAAAEEPDTPPEGMVANQLTGEWIDESLKDQRPIAVMVDDEKKALPHYGISTSDIVYEMVNSTQNEGVTRFMVMVKDWGSIKQLGSIRSTRPTNLQIFPEWNAVLCHDGGPFWNDNFYKNVFVERFSGTFSRVDNGKAREFTEYILPGDLEKNFKNTGFSTTYNEYYMGDHYVFARRDNPNMLTQYSSSIDCKKISLPFHHNNPWLEYDEAEGVYKYFQYNQPEVDAGNGNKQISFKNIFIQNARMEQLDDHGYMMYYPSESDRDGWYITNGKAYACKWSKQNDLDPTKFYDENGELIRVNVGKSYIALIKPEEWSNIVIE
ncbi:MAG: DUF3048 domain-containing protein [Lachnospiraceae bacterium]|nr:DUF3048 domain-containing protein [Lachnospiraceae bacterium]